MQLVTHPSQLAPAFRQAVVALGNFDGVHKGHQVVLSAAKRLVSQKQKPLGVVTFEPHPRSLFIPGEAPFRITPASVKRHLLADMGVDVLFEIPFTPDFAQLGAEAFIEEYLVRGFAISHAVAGHDFVFGHKRGGTISLLRETLALHGVGVEEVSPQLDEHGQIWSSTRIRAHIQKGEVRAAATLLGRSWEIEGTVIKGDARGRDLGFPTANIDPADTLRPLYGVYAVEVLVAGQKYKGVANLGIRPTVDGRAEKLEIHLFDFSGDLYGQCLRVTFVDFIRAEQAFASLEALKNQIAKDCLVARSLLN